MGYKIDDRGIRSFSPDDTETEIYFISDNYTLQDIIEECKRRWPNTLLEDIDINSEHIHTNCLGYDLYDPSDYTDYIIATQNI